jgi:hypothetical protein
MLWIVFCVAYAASVLLHPPLLKALAGLSVAVFALAIVFNSHLM